MAGSTQALAKLLAGQAGARLSVPERLLLVERAETPSEIQAALSDASLVAMTGFQRAGWVRSIYRWMAPAVDADPVVVSVRDPVSGGIICVLPLVIVRESGLRIARFADLGVCDYNAPLLGPAAGEATNWASVVSAVKRAMSDCDVVQLERMPQVAGAGLAQLSTARAARHSGNALTVVDSVDTYIAGRGKKYRKEVERCFRVLAGEGAWEFSRCVTPDQIAAAYSALERQQGERHADKHDAYTLSQPQYAKFYREVLADGLQSGAAIFMLKVDGNIIAVLLGVVYQSTFLLLRIANGGEAWRHVSPGRLIVVCAMKELFAQGVNTFDMGIGDYQFKRGFGTEPIVLVDVLEPISLKGRAWVLAQRMRARLRDNERVRGVVQMVRARLGKT
jgi:CelD/BcsL family acetyltransferase involved in cellulose biosynthesis